MSNKGTVLFGLVVFIVVATFPVWYSRATGDPGLRPKVELPAGETKCVEDKQYMTAWHMDLLNSWRDAVVRDGKRLYISEAYGDKHEMSLTKTCLKCHTSKEKFCDKCHEYADVSPYCWDCHLERRGE